MDQLNIIVPMAGRGSRFAEAGYTIPKPLLPVHGVPMIELVIANVRPSQPHRFIFLCLRDHVEHLDCATTLRRAAPGCEIIIVDQVTEGAACTVLLARDQINNASPLMIANSDQWIDHDINSFLSVMPKRHLDGLIMTMEANDPKWSYVRMDDAGEVIEVVEKKVVSHQATVGIYCYARGADFVAAADEMIRHNERVNNEFYVAPAYNRLLAQGQKLGVHSIGSVEAGMHGLGTPRDLELFLTREASYRAAEVVKRTVKKAA